jgi:hypothetical protein
MHFILVGFTGSLYCTVELHKCRHIQYTVLQDGMAIPVRLNYDIYIGALWQLPYVK